MDSSADERLLRKYRDWCSARLAEHFLELSPEEIYELASQTPADEEASWEAPGGGEGPPLRRRPPEDPALHDHATPPAVASSSSYRNLIERVTETLARRLHLPTFEEWSAAYADDPERFDRDLWHGDSGRDAPRNGFTTG